MKVRILSDLHIYEGRNDLPVYNDNIFTIICGDISTNRNLAFDWIDKNVKQGVLVEGNHIGYEGKNSIQFIESCYTRKYPLTADISYLRNNYKVVGDYVFVGGILWTDFKLNGCDEVDSWLAPTYVNDFKYNIVNTKSYFYNKKIEYKKDKVFLQPNHWRMMFAFCYAQIIRVCATFPDKKIVVVTHHAPSSMSIPQKYKGMNMNVCFASNLSKLILENENIVAWCHGHIHTACDYKIGNCRVINNPVGYKKETTGFNKDLIIDL